MMFPVDWRPAVFKTFVSKVTRQTVNIVTFCIQSSLAAISLHGLPPLLRIYLTSAIEVRLYLRRGVYVRPQWFFSPGAVSGERGAVDVVVVGAVAVFAGEFGGKRAGAEGDDGGW
jgi:hypothetical protein